MFKAKLLQPEIDYKTGHVIARAEIIEGNYREFYEAIISRFAGFVRLIIKEWREKRSLNANAYFHVLVGKIADRLETSKAEVKNRMLSLYGQIDIMDDKPVYLIVPDHLTVEKWETLHLRATSQTKELAGVTYRVYMKVRGSRTYTTAEMSMLINGTISEAKEAGLTEAEIMSARERDMLEKRYNIRIGGVA